MEEEKAHNVMHDGRKWNPILIAVVSTIIGSGSGVALVFNTPTGQQAIQSTARPDPFTGSQGAVLTERVLHLEQEIRLHEGNHPDIINQFDRRITVLEVQYDGIMGYLERIDKKIDNLNK